MPRSSGLPDISDTNGSEIGASAWFDNSMGRLFALSVAAALLFLMIFVYLPSPNSDAVAGEASGPSRNSEAFIGLKDGNGYYTYGDAGHWVMLITMGQSNAAGAANDDDPDDPRYGTAAVYPEHAFMFSGGVRRYASSRGDQALVPLAENKGTSGTAASSWAAHLIRDLEAKTGARPKVLAFVAAIGASDLDVLSRGGQPNSYQAMLDGVDDGLVAIRAKGGKRMTVVVSFRQGEGEVAVPLYQRRAALRAFIRSLRADIAERTGQTEPVIVLLSQTASIRFLADAPELPYTNPKSPQYPKLWNNQYGRLAPLEMDHNGELTFAGPMYPFPYILGPKADYKVHLSNRGQNYIGQQDARATLNELFGQGWRGLRLMPETLRWVSSRILRIDADTPGILILDTSNIVISTKNLVNGTGIEAYSEAFAVPPFVARVSGRTLELIFTDPPVGPFKLGIAIGTNADVNLDGPLTGARSILRSSIASENIFDKTMQYDWCPATLINVPRGPG